MQFNKAFQLYKELVLASSSKRARQTEEGRWELHLAPLAGAWELEEIGSLKISILHSSLVGKGLSPHSQGRRIVCGSPVGDAPASPEAVGAPGHSGARRAASPP